MLVLAFSTSTDRGSVAVADNGKVIGSTHWKKTAHGSEVLTPKIKSLLDKLKIKPQKLEALAVDRGPGSFTGCRIAAGVAKTMGFVLNLPVAAIPSLDVIAEAAAPTHEGKILSVLDAHKALLFARWYQSDGRSISGILSPVEVSSPDALAEKLAPGDLVTGLIPPTFAQAFLARGARRPSKEDLNFPQAKVLARFASLMPAEKFKTWKEFEPIYIRAPDAVEKFEKQRTQSV